MPTSRSSPSRRPAGTWARFLGALVVLVVVAVGIPVGLVIAARAGLGSSSPLPGTGTWDEIRSWATTQRSSTEVASAALRLLISLCWLLWAALVSSVLSSVVQSRPRFGHVRIPRIAVFDGFGTWIVAGLTALTSLTPNVPHVAAAPTAPLPTVAAAPTVVAAGPTASNTPAGAPRQRPGWDTVQAAESIEMFAARTLGSAARWPEVFELNQGRVMSDGQSFTAAWKLTAGWELELPAGRTPVAPVEAAPPAVETSAAPYRPAAEIIVADGDNLWDISTARLREAGVDDRDVAVAQLVAQVAELNAIADPNLIYTGQGITFPAVDGLADATAIEAEPASPAEGAHTIVPGDTLWDILEAYYGYVDVPLVHHVADYNGIADPNNIALGTVIRLPALPGPTIGVSSSTPTVDGSPAEPAPEVGGDSAPTGDAAAAPTEVAGDVSTLTPTTEAPASSSVPPAVDIPAVPSPRTATTPPPLRLVPSPPLETRVPAPPPSPVPWAVAGVASVGLATGLLELWRRRRRARWAGGGSVWQVGAASEQLPGELTDVADLITVEWVAASLAHLAADPAPDDAFVVSVEFDESVLTVRWSRPRPIVAAPWWASDDGWVWNLASSARLLPAEDGPIVGFPGLVTLGEREGRQYLLNLAAARTVAVDGPAAEGLVGAIALELAAGELLSDAVVHLHGVELHACEQLDRVIVGFDDELELDASSLHVSIIESDDPELDELIAATVDNRRAVVILGTSDRAVGAELRVDTDAAATHDPSGMTFHASLVPDALIPLDADDLAVPAPPALEAPAPNVVRLDRVSRGSLTSPRMVLRVFSNLLPDLDPRQPGVDARAMTIIAALDHLGAGRPPHQLAELLRIKVKTIQNKLGRLRELQLVHSDGNIWTLDAGVCSDADWTRDLAQHARDATSRETAIRALNECWELFTRATGPAYANGGGSPLWGWVHERDEDLGGPTAAEQATSTLFEAVQVAVESWDTLAATGLDDLISADNLVDILLRLESTLRAVEPWPLFEAAATAAHRTGLASTRQKLATRLAALVHDSDLDPPDALVAQVIG